MKTSKCFHVFSKFVNDNVIDIGKTKNILLLHLTNLETNFNTQFEKSLEKNLDQ